MKRGRNKYEELDGGGTVSTALKPETFVSDPHLKDLGQIGVGGSEISSRLVYFAVCHRDGFASQTGYPLYKVDVALSNSNSNSEDTEDSLEPPAPGRVKLRRIATLETDMGGKTFISMESGWIIGIGGNPGGTIIFDTMDSKVIRGPKLITNKWCPVVAAVGNKIYALSSRPDFLPEPDLVPWFEVLDLSKATITETAEVPILDGCSWEALPYPLFPCKLTPTACQYPPITIVRSSVVVEPYILILLNQPTKCVYVFDTNTEKWHKIDDDLPFVGAATQLGHGSSIFLASSWENGPINAYDIHVSSVSSPKNISSDADDKGGALKLSITVFSIRNRYGEVFCAKKAGIITSLGKEHFCELLSSEGCGRYMVYDKETEEIYPGKLDLQLCTYQTEIRALQGGTSEIVVSGQQELKSRVRSSRGFSSAPIAFALSI